MIDFLKFCLFFVYAVQKELIYANPSSYSFLAASYVRESGVQNSFFGNPQIKCGDIPLFEINQNFFEMITYINLVKRFQH